MLVYAQSECVNELVTLGQQVSLLRDEQATLREPFGTEELNRVTLQLHADVFTDTLAPRAESDDLEGVLAVLDTVHQIAVKHETWRDECVELLEHPEDHELIGGDIEITRIVVDGAVDDLKNHDVHISQLIEYCAMDWQQYFKNFGKKRYARTLREMTDVAVKAINAGDTSAGDGIEHARRRVRRVVRQRVRGNRPLRFRQTKSRHRARRARQSSSLRGQKVQQASTLALKRSRLTKKPGFFKSLFGGGGQSASEEESNDVDSATEIDEFADERSQSDDDAPAPGTGTRNRLRRTFDGRRRPRPRRIHRRVNAHITSVSMYSTFYRIPSHPIPSPVDRRPRLSARPARSLRGTKRHFQPSPTSHSERARVRPSRAFDAPLSRDMTRDFLVPDSFADLCVDDDDDDDETRGVVAQNG